MDGVESANFSFNNKSYVRALLQKGKVSISQLNQVLESHNVRLTQEELRRLIKLSQAGRGNSGDFTSP